MKRAPTPKSIWMSAGRFERWRQAGVIVDVIAEKLGRHRSTNFRISFKWEDTPQDQTFQVTLVGGFHASAAGSNRLEDCSRSECAFSLGDFVAFTRSDKSRGT